MVMTECCWEGVELAGVVRGAAGRSVVREVLLTLLAPAGLGSVGGSGFGIEPEAERGW